MLVLTRKESESVTVTVQGITFNILVKELTGNRVQLGFDATDKVVIYRTELLTPTIKEDQ
jgi:carbon storage regulator CsrA